jgi:hypothetical protein
MLLCAAVRQTVALTTAVANADTAREIQISDTTSTGTLPPPPSSAEIRLGSTQRDNVVDPEARIERSITELRDDGGSRRTDETLRSGDVSGVQPFTFLNRQPSDSTRSASDSTHGSK